MPPPIAGLSGVLERVRRTSSPGLAGPSTLLGPDFPSRRLSVGDFHQEGFLIFGTVDVAPEGARLISSGLSTEVTDSPVQSSLHEETVLLEVNLHFLTRQPPARPS